MDIFVDFDDTLYATGVENCRNVGQLLLLYLDAPIFDGAKEAIEEFCKNGHTCWGASARGAICEEEITVTKSRLRQDGFFAGKNSLISGVVAPCLNKYLGIKYVYDNKHKKEIEPQNCILIDDCLEALLDAADHDVHCILFAPDMKEFDAETQEILDKLKITVAHSWQEVKSLVESMCEKHEDPEKEKVEPKSKAKEERTK